MQSRTTTLTNIDSIVPINSQETEDINIELPIIDINDPNNYIITPLATTSLEVIEKIQTLPKPMMKILNELANTFAITYSTIQNLDKQLGELHDHETNKTIPEYLLKQFKKVLKDDDPIKAYLLNMKLEELIRSKSIKLIEAITVFNSRASTTLRETEYARTTYQIPQEDINENQWIIVLDHLISNILVTFNHKQQKDKKKKEEKQEKLMKKREESNIPQVINTKDFKKLQSKIVKLEKSLTLKKSKTKTKGKNKPKNENKNNNKNNPNKSNPKKHFHKGRQQKSQAGPSHNPKH